MPNKMISMANRTIGSFMSQLGSQISLLLPYACLSAGACPPGTGVN